MLFKKIYEIARIRDVIAFWSKDVCYAAKCQGHWNADNPDTHGASAINAPALYCDVAEDTLRNTAELV
jgi:hypothetical protein